MSNLSVVDSDPFKEMEEVAKSMLKGHTEYKTARDLGLKVVEVRALWVQYKDRLNNDTFARDAARDHLNMMVRSYDDLINKMHANLDDLDTMAFDTQNSAQKIATVKTIGELQAKRVDALQKAGLLDNAELGDELAEHERQRDILIDILKNDLCPECQAAVAQKLQKVTNQVEVIEVFEDDEA